MLNVITDYKEYINIKGILELQSEYNKKIDSLYYEISDLEKEYRDKINKIISNNIQNGEN